MSRSGDDGKVRHSPDIQMYSDSLCVPNASLFGTFGTWRMS
jgi:hypothetical protein